MRQTGIMAVLRNAFIEAQMRRALRVLLFGAFERSGTLIGLIRVIRPAFRNADIIGGIDFDCGIVVGRTPATERQRHHNDDCR